MGYIVKGRNGENLRGLNGTRINKVGWIVDKIGKKGPL
jgi:hypothetical protein